MLRERSRIENTFNFSTSRTPVGLKKFDRANQNPDFRLNQNCHTENFMETMARILGFILLLSCSAFFFLDAVALSSHSTGLAGFSLILAIVFFIIGLTLFRGLPLLQASLHHARRENPSPWPPDEI